MGPVSPLITTVVFEIVKIHEGNLGIWGMTSPTIFEFLLVLYYKYFLHTGFILSLVFLRAYSKLLNFFFELVFDLHEVIHSIGLQRYGTPPGCETFLPLLCHNQKL